VKRNWNKTIRVITRDMSESLDATLPILEGFFPALELGECL